MHGNLIKNLNITEYTMFSNKGTKPRAAMLLSGVDAWPLAGCMHDLVVITARLKFAGTVWEVVIFLCSLPSLGTGLEEKWVRTPRKLDWDLSRSTLRSKLVSKRLETAVESCLEYYCRQTSQAFNRARLSGYPKVWEESRWVNRVMEVRLGEKLGHLGDLSETALSPSPNCTQH